jgi:hypothetical protein
MKKSAPLTNLQVELLNLFEYELSEKQLLEVRNILSTYFAEKATQEMDRLFEENNWDNQKIEDWTNEHLRTKYD